MIKMAVTGVLLTVGAMSCASSFPYKYYGIWPSKDVLLGSEPKNDLPLTFCEPDDVSKGKCVVFFTDEFDRLLTDYVSTKERLKRCEANGR